VVTKPGGRSGHRPDPFPSYPPATSSPALAAATTRTAARAKRAPQLGPLSVASKVDSVKGFMPLR